MTEPFHGAKLAILVGNHILTILRDDIPTIGWPDHWDLPGGGRESDETPIECVLRELHEELGLVLCANDLIWRKPYKSPPNVVWFFAAEFPDFDVEKVRFGDEGQEWRLAPIEWFLTHEKAIPNLQSRLRTYLGHR